MKGGTAELVLSLTRIVCPICKNYRCITRFILRRHIKHKHSESEAEEFIRKATMEL